jgi:hypothetical protein
MPAKNAKPAAALKPFARETLDALDGKPTSLDADAQIIYAAKMGRDVAIVSVSSYNGKLGLDVRRFYLGDDETWKPTSKGLRMPMEVVGPLTEALTAFREVVLSRSRDCVGSRRALAIIARRGAP